MMSFCIYIPLTILWMAVGLDDARYSNFAASLSRAQGL